MKTDLSLTGLQGLGQDKKYFKTKGSMEIAKEAGGPEVLGALHIGDPICLQDLSQKEQFFQDTGMIGN